MAAAAESRPAAAYYAVLLAATFLMGSSFIAGKVLLATTPPLALVGWRFFVAALATLPLALALERTPRGVGLVPAAAGRGRTWALVFVIGLLQTAGVMGFLFLSMETLSSSTAAILLFTNPLWVALLGRLFLKEPLHRGRLVGLAVGIVGVVLAIGATPLGALQGEVLGLLSSLCFAGSTVLAKRTRPALGSWSLSFWQMLAGSIVLLAIAYAAGEKWPAHTTYAEWVWFAWLAVPASTGSFGLWFVALRLGGATRSSGFLFLAPLFAVILSHLVLGTVLSWTQAAGGIAIGLAIYLINREPAAPRALSQPKDKQRRYA